MRYAHVKPAVISHVTLEFYY